MRRMGLMVLVSLSGCSLLNRLVVPQGARAAKKDTGPVRAVIDPASVTVSEGRLYFNAWTNAPSSAALQATLTGPGVAAEPVAFEHPPFQSPACVGVSIRPDAVNLVPECSFEIASASAGTYTLTVTGEGGTAGTHRFDLVPARNVDGSTSLSVSPGSRSSSASLSQFGLTVWVPVDVRDPVVAVSAVWFRDGKVLLTSRGLARGPFLDATDGPAQEVVGVGLRSEGQFKRSALEVVVVKEGSAPMAQFHVRPEDLDAIGTGGHVVLTATALDEALKGPALAAARRSVDALAALSPPQFSHEVSEPVACAVVSSAEARKAYRRLRKAIANQYSAQLAASEARSDAYRQAISHARREELLQQALGNESTAENDQRERAQRQRELDRFSKAQRPGCFATLLGSSQ